MISKRDKDLLAAFRKGTEGLSAKRIAAVAGIGVATAHRIKKGDDPSRLSTDVRAAIRAFLEVPRETGSDDAGVTTRLLARVYAIALSGGWTEEEIAELDRWRVAVRQTTPSTTLPAGLDADGVAEASHMLDPGNQQPEAAQAPAATDPQKQKRA